MSKFARIENKTALEVFTPPEGFGLADCFTPEVVALFTACPDNVTPGSTVDSEGVWTIAPAPAAPAAPEPEYPALSAMMFYLALTPSERIAVKKSADPMVVEFWATYQLAVQTGANVDMRLVSVQESINYLAVPVTATPPGPGILAPARVNQVLMGIPQ